MATRISKTLRRGRRLWQRSLEPKIRGMLGDREFERHALVGPARQWKAKRDWQMEFLRSQGLAPSATFLDIGCGTLRGGIPIIEMLDHGHYTGIDVRPHVLDEARAELASHPVAQSKEPRLVLSTGFATLDSLGPFDWVWGFSVLIHMTDVIARECFEYVGRELSDHGVFYANVNFGEPNPEKPGDAGFPVLRRPEEFYRELAAAASLTTSDLGTLSSLGHNLGRGDNHHMLRFSKSS